MRRELKKLNDYRYLMKVQHLRQVCVSHSRGRSPDSIEGKKLTELKNNRKEREDEHRKKQNYRNKKET